MPVADGRFCGGNVRDIGRRDARKPLGIFPATSRQSPGSFADTSGGCAAESSPVMRRTTQRIAVGVAASLPPGIRRRIGGGQILRERRGKASPLLNGLRDIFILLLNQFAAPVLELLGDGIRLLSLLPRIYRDLPKKLTCLNTARHLSNRTSGMVVDTKIEFPQHLDGGMKF